MQVRIRITRRAKRHGQVFGALNGILPAEGVAEPSAAPASRPAMGASSLVAAGILASRITGLIRERVIAHYFGADWIADAFRAATRIPNLLGNLFGEGVISASFVTVYSKLRALGKDEEADQLAAAIFGVLTLVCSVTVLAGVLLTPLLIDLIAPGYQGERRALTIQIVRILFPGTGLLVLSAWCLGVLNSHRRFLLSYMAPIALNAAVVSVAVLFGRYTAENKLIFYVAWGYVAGSALQFLVQLPKVLQLLPRFRPALDFESPSVRSVLRNFGPIFVSRGVVQISAYVDQMIASLLPQGAFTFLSCGQVIGVLPVSLFSMSVSAAELPALSSAVGSTEEIAAVLRNRLQAGLRRIAFFIVPCAVAFLVLGDVLAAALYQGGRFHHADAVFVWSVLAGSAVGLLATSLGRLYSSTFYALLDTKTPLRFAILRVALTTGLGLLFALPLPRWLGIDARWGVAGLTASAGIAGWVEFALLRRSLRRRIGGTPLPAAFLAKLWAVSFLAAAVGYALKRALGTAHPLPLAFVIVPVYAAIYFAVTAGLGVSESRTIAMGTLRRLRLHA